MKSELSVTEEINILASEAKWAWPEAVRKIFRPRGVNLMVARDVNEFVGIIKKERIHTAILDMDNCRADAFATVRIIHKNRPKLPCILLSGKVCKSLLNKALELDVFSVIDKPVSMAVLNEQLDRLFQKKYGSMIFGEQS